MKAVKTYNAERITVATLASHTALQILRAAKHAGFRTLAIASASTSDFYRRFSFVDTVLTASPRDIERLAPDLVERNTIFIPHGSFVEYCGPEKAQEFNVPFFGTRKLIAVEASQSQKMQLLREAGISTPKEYWSAEEAEPPVIVKFQGAKGGKGYFIAKDKKTIQEKLRGTNEPYIIQEYLIGVPAYVHFFASPLFDRVELFGADVRYESNVDGRVLGLAEPSFTVVGNRPLVLRESLLPKLVEYGEAFAKSVEKKTGQKMIGPFCLETIINENIDVKVFEFSGRIVAGTNVYMGAGSPYSTLYFDKPIDMGERIALEIREAVKKGLLELVTT
ncbi:MAG: formate--phosphoribosylaminoimidazolecarboxamide ligase [Candidatus Caldarchaeum sp.]|uniref:Formate--phosphoribosylaminoimidazolecarboxamide ligase n=1 Tax=Caldiarchaeum subterraneum TaxID=311458 RepID=A0A7C5LCU2_CALS0